MATFLSRVGAGSARHRLTVVLAWVLVLVGVGVGAATLSGATSSSLLHPGRGVDHRPAR